MVPSDGLPAEVALIMAIGRDVTETQRTDAAMRAVEDVGRLLAQAGPRPEVLDRVLEILEERFGYRYTSIYLWDGRVMHRRVARLRRPHRRFRWQLRRHGAGDSARSSSRSCQTHRSILTTSRPRPM